MDLIGPNKARNGEHEDVYVLILNEQELDALRHPCGRIVGDHEHPIRQATSEFYYAARDALGYQDSVASMTHYLEVVHAIDTDPSTRRG